MIEKEWFKRIYEEFRERKKKLKGKIEERKTKKLREKRGKEREKDKK